MHPRHHKPGVETDGPDRSPQRDPRIHQRASERDDIDLIHIQLREMRGVVNNVLPPVKRGKPQPKKPSLKVLE
jgi:hypothetical protein